MTDWGALYSEHVSALTALSGGLGPEQLEVRVPGSPEWTVREVFAHVAGVAADGLAGRTDGAPGDEWTARQVAERSTASIGEVTDELASNIAALSASFEADGHPGACWDLAVHHADVHEALGKHPLPEHLWEPVLAAVGGRIPAELAAAASPYEQFRLVFSRRSRAQAAAYGSGLSAEQLDEIPVFGARDDDQPVPSEGRD